MLRLLLTLVLVASTSAVDTSVAEVKRMIASMRTEEAAALEVQYHVHEAAGLHDQMVKINDKFFAAHAEAGTAREQALRKSLHEDGLYHTLFKVADTVPDYAFLETVMEHATAASGLDLSKVRPTAADVDKFDDDVIDPCEMNTLTEDDKQACRDAHNDEIKNPYLNTDVMDPPVEAVLEAGPEKIQKFKKNMPPMDVDMPPMDVDMPPMDVDMSPKIKRSLASLKSNVISPDAAAFVETKEEWGWGKRKAEQAGKYAAAKARQVEQAAKRKARQVAAAARAAEQKVKRLEQSAKAKARQLEQYAKTKARQLEQAAKTKARQVAEAARKAREWAAEQARQVAAAAKRAKEAAEAAAKKLVEEAKKAAAAAAALATRVWHAAVKFVEDGVLKVLEPVKKGVEDATEKLEQIKDLGKEVKLEIKNTADKIKSTVVKIATTMKDAAKLIETPFKTVFNQLKTKLPAALENKDDCAMLKIKPDSVGTEEKRYNWCETILKKHKCLSIPYIVPVVKFVETEFCNPAQAVKAVMEDAFTEGVKSLKPAAKEVIEGILSSIDGNFLETAEGMGNTAQLLAQINEQQGEGASKVTRSHLRASAMTTGGLDECSIGKADFAVWFRYGVSIAVGTGAVGASLSANLGIAFGCDGAGTAFMFPTIDIGLDLEAGVGVTGGAGHSLGIDIFANFDGLGQQGHSQESTWASGCGRDEKDCKCGPGGGGSVWGNKLGWGLGASLNVGDFGLGFSFTMPALKIGTTNILGIELPTSAAVDRPRLAGIGISGDASAIWTLLAGSPSGIIEPVVEGLADTMGISVSLGIGYVGIIGGDTTNWFAAPLMPKSDKGAAGASCNNLLNAEFPASIFHCGDNVFQALPKSFLTEWPFI